MHDRIVRSVQLDYDTPRINRAARSAQAAGASIAAGSIAKP
jgi:hypothetical protein